MKKFLMVALVAILGTASAVAQTALSFSGDRAVIKSGGKYYIPQSVWSNPDYRDEFGHWTLYLDVVNTVEPEIGYEGFVGDNDNSWGTEPGSQRTNEEKRKQYIKVDVPGIWTNIWGTEGGALYIRRIADPTLTVGSVSKPLSQWNSPINVSAGENVTLNVNTWFTLGTSGGGGGNRLLKEGQPLFNQSMAEYDLSIGSGTINYEFRSSDGVSRNEVYTVSFDIVYATSAPAITNHPQNQMVNVGETATFGITATGSNLAYQWKKDGATIAGATNATYSKANVQSTDAGVYTCVVSNAGGSTTSNGATLTVNVSAPVITNHPQNQTVNVGETATFSITATGSNLTYQWKKDGATIAGATNATYSKANVQSTDAGVYTCVVSNTGGSVVSNGATLTVNVPVDYSWLTQPTIEFTVSGNALEIKAVGVSSETFNNVTVNGTEISQTGGKWIVDVSSAGIRIIKMSNNAGVILTRTHQK
ncbi:MAG: immunoglobulin domain-containing protein [Prevotella sp.]|jgi:predicted RNA-binding protein with TRAM domain|nr:immunoglobulin domain-containing protein [Prevotella sp.]